MFGKSRSPHPIKLSQLASLVADGVEIEGDIVFSGGLRVDGRVRGSLTGRTGENGRASLLVLSQTAQVEGRVHCGNALINGQVVGDLAVDDYVELQAGACITGTLRYRQIQMDVGATVQGQLIRIGDEPAAGDGGAKGRAAQREPKAVGERRPA
jgi:cytoskeletal protein CcmA (bactofilin family)